MKEVLNKQLTAGLIGIIIALSILLFFSVRHSDKLQQKLSDIQTQSDTIAREHSRKVIELSEKYENEKSDINKRHDAIVARLRSEGDGKLPPVTRECESEYRERAGRVLAELSGIYANVAKYADQLKLTGGNCEALRE